MDERRTPPRGFARPPSRPFRGLLPYIAAAAVLLLAGIVLWLLLVDDPLGGEPQAVSEIRRLGAVAPPRPAPPAPPPGAPARDVPLAPESTGSGPLIIKIPRESGSGGALQSTAGAVRAPDPLLEEASPTGPLPRIGSDGRQPVDVYARAEVETGGLPAIGILVVLDAAADPALDLLPPGASLALSPYRGDLEEVARAARARGHELVLAVPMDSFGREPGPQTLKTSLPASANLERLHWSLGRFGGYFALAPLEGGRFLGDATALRPVMLEAARRGVGVLDTAATPRSAVPETARETGARTAAAELQIAADAAPGDLEAALSRLEMTARSSGAAFAVVAAGPATLPPLRAWAEGLPARGFAPVPVSAILRRDASSRQGAP